MELVKAIILLLGTLSIAILSVIFLIKEGIKTVKMLKAEKDIGIQGLMYIMLVLFLFPLLVYIFDRYDLATKLHFADNLVSGESWLDFLSSYVGTSIGVIFSAAVLLVVTKKQIDKTFENARKKDEIAKYNKEIAILNLYIEAIKETKNNIKEFLKWLKAFKKSKLKAPDGNPFDTYSIKYSGFLKRYLYNVAEREFEKSFEYISDKEVFNSIVNMLGKSKEVLRAIQDDESDPLVNSPMQRIFKAQKRKIIEKDVDEENDNSIFRILDDTERIINNRLNKLEENINTLIQS